MTRDRTTSPMKLKLLAMGGAAAMALFASANTAAADNWLYGAIKNAGEQVSAYERGKIERQFGRSVNPHTSKETGIYLRKCQGGKC